jgi:hypothetical protein
MVIYKEFLFPQGFYYQFQITPIGFMKRDNIHYQG